MRLVGHHGQMQLPNTFSVVPLARDLESHDGDDRDGLLKETVSSILDARTTAQSPEDFLARCDEALEQLARGFEKGSSGHTRPQL